MAQEKKQEPFLRAMSSIKKPPLNQVIIFLVLNFYTFFHTITILLLN